MIVLPNNCVATIAVPKKAHSGGKVAYNPVLKLFVTMGKGEGISVWSPETGKVVELIDYGGDGCLDMLLAPRNHLVMSYSEGNHGGVVEIYSLEKLNKKSEPKLVLRIKDDFLPGHPGMMALSPHNSLLVVDGFGDSNVCDISIDWDKPKVLKLSYLENDEYLDEIYIYNLCCTPNYSVVEGVIDGDSEHCLLVGRNSSPKEDQFSDKDRENSENKEEELCTEQIEEEQIKEELDTTLLKNDVDDNSDDSDDSSDDYSDDDRNKDKHNDVINGDVIPIKREVIDHCILDGLEYKLNRECKLIHDGKNLLIFSDDKIILLETLTNVSKAHLVVSGLPINTDLHAKQGLGINHKGQLMVCDDENSIKIYEYRCIPRSLQDLCRCCIAEAIPSSYQESIKKLPLPATLTDYLLFKDLGY